MIIFPVVHDSSTSFHAASTITLVIHFPTMFVFDISRRALPLTKILHVYSVYEKVK